jgi:hypothetical protein
MKSIYVKVSLLNNTCSYVKFSLPTYSHMQHLSLDLGFWAYFTLQNLENHLELASQPKLNSNL